MKCYCADCRCAERQSKRVAQSGTRPLPIVARFEAIPLLYIGIPRRHYCGVIIHASDFVMCWN